MDIFERNLAALGEKNKNLERLLRASGPAVNMEETRTGEGTFSFGGRYFHSRHDPWKEASVQAGEILSKKPDWVLLFGLGCGYLLRTLSGKGKKKIIIFEPSMDILGAVLRKFDLSGELSMEKVFLCSEIGEAVNLVRNQTEGLDDLLCYQSTPYKLTFPEELVELINKVKNAHVANRIGVQTDIVSREAWVENFFSNLGSFAEYPPIDILKGRLDGIPMVIAGAGPSLKKNAHLLKNLKGRAIIVAAITAYKPLLKSGVIPDFVIAAEKVDLPEYFTFGEDDRKTRLILGDISHPEMFGRDVLGKFVFFSSFSSLSLRQARHWGSSFLPMTGGSVTTTALDIGVQLGCNPIMFVGQDLSFGQGETHAPGGVYVSQDIKIDVERGRIDVSEDYITHNDKVNTSFDLLWLKGLDGKKVASKFDWVIFHQWFENYMEHLNREMKGVKVINATEGGAYIEGMEHMPLSEAIERHVKGAFDIEEVLGDAVAHRPPVDYKGLKKSLAELEKGLNDAGRASRKIRKEAELAENILARHGVQPGLSKHVESIKKNEAALFDAAEKAEFLFEAACASTYTLNENLRGDDELEAAERFSRDLRAIGTSSARVNETCRKFAPVLKGAMETINKLEARSHVSCCCGQDGGTHQCKECKCA